MDRRAGFLLPPLFLFILLSLKTDFSSAADIINPGESLTGKQTLTSNGGNFELGFFRPGPSPKFYLAIWYMKVSKQTAVWVANRETPLQSEASQARIGEDGNLVVVNPAGDLIWSSNSTFARPNSTVLELLDSGNLVLRDRSNSSDIFWQSFDNPTNTWLPGGWLGMNKVTGERQLLTSWRNSEDPASGPYSLELDPDNNMQYIIRQNRSHRFWSSGPWNGQIFSGVPEMRATYIYNFSFVNTTRGNYFTYSVYNSSTITRFVIDLTGQIKQLTWVNTTKEWFLFWSQPRAQCEVYSLCGSFGLCSGDGLPPCSCVEGFEPRFSNDWNLSDWSGGCQRTTPLNCGRNVSSNGKKDAFQLVPNVAAPDNPQSVSVQSSGECESACLNDCSCTAYSFSGGCSLWRGELLNLQRLAAGNPQAIELRLRLAASAVASPSSSSSNNKKGAVVGIAVGATVVCVALVGVFIFWLRRRSQRSKVVGALRKGSGSLIPFTYRNLQIITKNFSDKLGGGGFGSVFRGVLPDSSIVAVKKLENLGQGEKQFRAEVSTIGTIQHMNLVRLRGFCSEGSERLLVYDYMPNGSLDTLLLDKTSKALDWKRRYQIALGAARGLAYLHEECRDCIIHCDIKPENILLDSDFCPKVADFGLAKLIGRDFSRVLTTMRGTRGYLAPEWISGVAITAKADVYSYGMMLFEIVSGRRNIEQSEDGKVVFFPTWAANKMTEGDVLSLVDSRLAEEVDLEQVERACRVACWCIQDEEDDRPSMGQVVKILEGLLEVNLPPVPRSLHNLVLNLERGLAFSEVTSHDQSSQLRSTDASSNSSSQTKSSSSTRS